ncbi:hypothetical protein M0R45_006709 [Rubus argutus]|uniref:BED-type domain-containing protein n=1 Tax=Rubus argutus TaxID=59490 RepID=A0AAW1YRQ1_RUBAR
MESNSITPTPSPATNFTHSSTGTTPSQTPTSTPIPVSSSQVPTIQNGASVPPIDSASIPPIDSASIPPLESVKRKNKSIAWEHFTKMTNPDGSKMAKARAKCSHCTQTYAVDSKSNGTTNMRTHLLYQCRKSPLFIPSKKQRYLAFDSAENGGNHRDSMKIKFDKYWNKLEDMNKILIIAVVLDPRYKLLYLEYFFPKLQKDQNLVELMVSEMKSMFLKLFKEYAAADPEAFQASMDATLPKPANVTADQCDEDSHAENLQGFMKLRQEKDVVEIKHEKLVSLMLLRLKSEMKW